MDSSGTMEKMEIGNGTVPNNENNGNLEWNGPDQRKNGTREWIRPEQ